MRHLIAVSLAASWVASLGCGSSGGTARDPAAPAVSAVAAGSYHTCAALASGAVRCWGANSDGELGDGAHPGDWSFVPLQVASVSSPLGLAAGGSHSCVRVAAGAVWCWGRGAYGELGSGVLLPRSATPVAVAGLTGATQIAAGSGHSCAVVTGGTVRCWGANDFGQLGDPSVATTLPDDRSAEPVTVASLSGATAVAAGNDHSCALLGDASVACWGGPFNGVPYRAPYHEPVAITSLAGVVSIAAGTTHNCALVTGGRVKCWGSNASGQLGTGAVGGASPTEAVDVVGLGSAAGVTAGPGHSCALLGGGTVACWGRNDRGELGDGTYTDRPSPVAVTGLAGAIAVTAGSEHTCAIVSGGAVKCWGDNQQAQLGLDPNLVQTSAVPVTIGF